MLKLRKLRHFIGRLYNRMLSFEPFSLDALKRVMPYVLSCPYHCSDMTPGELYMWHKEMNTQFCVWNDTFMVRKDLGDQPSFTWPYGADPDGMVEELRKYAIENDLPLRFREINAETLEVMRAGRRFPSLMAAMDARWSDYFYSFEDALTFHGKKFSGQRNHINKFRRLYGEPDVRPLRPEDRPKLMRLLDAYAAEHAAGNAIERIELENTRRFIDVYEELGLYAACLHVGEELAAFSIGGIVGDMLVIHVEKALRRFEGAYPTMYQGFVRLVGESCARPPRYVNREDDSGDPGLRTSKRQYHPISMIDKYLVHVDSPAARAWPLPMLRAGDVVLTEFREEDRAAYMHLNLDVENNRWWGYDYREDTGITGPIDENTFYDFVQYDMRAGDSINFAVRETESGEMIGEGILWHFTATGRAEVGLRLSPEYHGKGYGTAAYSALANYAEQALGCKAVARCYLSNLPSYRMITGSGFRVVKQDAEFYYFERPERAAERRNA